MKKLSVVGLGKLGLTQAVCLASRGFEVIGIDINAQTVKEVNRGELTFYEPGLADLLKKSKKKFRASQKFGDAILKSDVTFFIVPTPSKKNGEFSVEYLKNAIGEVARAFRGVRKKYHLFVITSTISPGTIEKKLIPLIETVAKKKLNLDFGVCYNPDFIALGSIIDNFLNPDFVLIGESDTKAGELLAAIYKKMCSINILISRMSMVSAEIAKLSLNSYITLKISFANTLGNICENVIGADVDAITGAIGQDRRVSPHYLKAGPSYGGPCFPRDNRAFWRLAKDNKVDALLAKSADKINDYQLDYLMTKIIKYLPRSKIVAILGMAYKPKTEVIEESAGVRLCVRLLNQKIKDLKIIVYDPLAINNVKKYFKDKVLYARSIRECFNRSSLCVITTADGHFKEINDDYFTDNLTTIIDCWRILEPSKFRMPVKYLALGRNSNEIDK